MSGGTLGNEGILRLTVLSHVGLFLHPVRLRRLPTRTPSALGFSQSNGCVGIRGPSPFCIALIGLRINDRGLKGTVTTPEIGSRVPLPSKIRKGLGFRAIGSCNSMAPIERIGLGWPGRLAVSRLVVGVPAAASVPRECA